MAKVVLRIDNWAKRRRSVDVVGWTLVLLASAVVFAKLGGISRSGYRSPSWLPWTWRPGPLFRDTTTTGGDMGAHVWTPYFLRRHLSSSLFGTGWSKDWFAGFPVLHFYFPAPSWLITLVGFLIPANVAFKLVTVLGLVSLPLATMLLARIAGLASRYRYLFALASFVFILDPGYSFLGGNVLSTMAGEFSFSISLSLAVAFLAVLIRVIQTGRSRALAVVLLAGTGLSHLLPTLFVAMGAGVIVGVHMTVNGGPTRLRRLGDAALVGVVAFLCAAFWIVPFAANLAFTNDMEWETATAYLGALFPPLADAPTTGSAIMGAVVVLAIIGAVRQVSRFVLAIVGRREPDPECRLATCLTLMAMISALAFRFPPSFRILNERALPFYFLCCCLLASFGLTAIAAVLRFGLRRSGLSLGGTRHSGAASLGAVGVLCWWSVGGVAGILPGVVPMPKLDGRSLSWQRADASTDRNPFADWAKDNYDGYEATKEWPELRALIDELNTIGRTEGCGRAMADYEDELDRYGTEWALTLLPMWTKGCIGSMEGLYLESSASVPYHYINAALLSARPGNPQSRLPYPKLDVAAGVRRLQQWGVRYYLVFSPSAQAQARVHPDLRLLATTAYTRSCTPEEESAQTCPSTMEIYEVANSALVAGLSLQPAVLTNVGRTQRGGWLDVAMAQYTRPDQFPVPLVSDGPPSWPRVAARVDRVFASNFGDGTSVAPTLVKTYPTVKVTDIHEGDGVVTFHVDRVGVPVVVRESYFPTWRAHGADGPYRLAPNMMVVIPTDRSVTVRIEPDVANQVGLALTLIGILATVALVHHERRRRASASAEPSTVT